VILFASDLDNTLIYSYKKAAGTDICVESKDGKELSFMTPNAYSRLQHIADKMVFVPVTTRSLEQYRRIRLLKDSHPKYALTSNGGILLVDNKIHEEWYKETKELIKDSMDELIKGINILRNDPNVYMDVRLIDEIFVFTKTKNITESIADLQQRLDMNKVNIDSNGEKLYILPNSLTKGIAVERLKEVLGVNFVICAGDSYFDVPMLKVADIAVVPRYSNIDSHLNSENLVISESEGMEFGDRVLETVFPYTKGSL